MSRDQQLSRRKVDAEVGGVDAKLRVLAIDDDPSYLRYLKHVLTKAGFLVEVAESGPLAVQKILDGCQVDLLIIDLKMPDLDGIETLRRIKEECVAPGVYTILLTAVQSTEVKLRALESGFDDFLSKTSSESEILAKIRSAARRLEMERQLHLENEVLQTLALTDELTGIANRRAIFQAGERILASGRTLSVALFDLDRFKSINDTFGHLAGDRILADVATAFKANTRYGDIIGRYGGDEFVLLLPETGSDEALQISERIQAKIRQLTWTISDSPLSVSTQYGVATSKAQSTLRELLLACDQAMYRDKRRVHESVTEARPQAR